MKKQIIAMMIAVAAAASVCQLAQQSAEQPAEL